MPNVLRMIIIILGLISIFKPKWSLLFSDYKKVDGYVEYTTYSKVGARISGVLFVVLGLISDSFYNDIFSKLPNSEYDGNGYLIIFIMFLLGVLCLIKPQWLMKITTFWKYKSEPHFNSGYMVWIRVWGGIVMIIDLIILGVLIF